MDNRIYTLAVRNSEVTVIIRFPDDNDDDALLETIDLILWKAQLGEELWLTGTITLHNPLGVRLLGVPERSATMVDDDE